MTLPDANFPILKSSQGLSIRPTVAHNGFANVFAENNLLYAVSNSQPTGPERAVALALKSSLSVIRVTGTALRVALLLTKSGLVCGAVVRVLGISIINTTVAAALWSAKNGCALKTSLLTWAKDRKDSRSTG